MPEEYNVGEPDTHTWPDAYDTSTKAEHEAWELFKVAKRIWCEDDATVGCEDHESLSDAIEKHVGQLPPKLAAFDGGDGFLRVHENGWLVYDGYGNSEIRKATP